MLKQTILLKAVFHKFYLLQYFVLYINFWQIRFRLAYQLPDLINTFMIMLSFSTKGLSMAQFGHNVFAEQKLKSSRRYGEKARWKKYIFTFGKSLKHAQMFLKLTTSNLKMFRKHQTQKQCIKRTEDTSPKQEGKTR